MTNEEIFDFILDIPPSKLDIFLFRTVLKIPPHIIAEKKRLPLDNCLSSINLIERLLKTYPQKKHDDAIAALQELLGAVNPSSFLNNKNK